MAQNTLLSQRILVTGITGIHGWPVYCGLSTLLPPDRLIGIGPPRMKKPKGEGIQSFCVTNIKRLRQIRDQFRPTVIIHAAGVCDLDVCEQRPQWADQINRTGTAVVAEVFGDTALILYLSTDLVFSGIDPPMGGYDEEHIPDPVSIAGKTFIAGEQELAGCQRYAIVRLGLPMGPSVTGDKGGLDWIEGRLRKKRPVTLFSDEYRSVISCREVARCVGEFVACQISGVFHLGGSVPVSLYGLGRMIVEGGGYDPMLLNGILRNEEQNGPPRMGNVALNSSKILPYLSASPGTWRYGESM